MHMFITNTRRAIHLLLLGQIEGICITNKYFTAIDLHTHTHKGVSRLVDITAGGDFLGLCYQKSLYKHVSEFGQLWSYGHFLIPVHAIM